MIVRTVPTRGYAVLSQNACTVKTTLPSGSSVTLASISASGGDSSFIAVSDSVELSDDMAYLLPLAPHAFPVGRAIGGASASSPGEEGSAKMILSENGTQLTLHFDDSDGPELWWLSKLFPNVTHVKGSLGGVTKLSSTFEGSVCKMKTLDLDLSKIVTMSRTFYGNNAIETIDLVLPVCTTFEQVLQGCTYLTSARIILPVCSESIITSIYVMSRLQSLTLHIPAMVTFSLDGIPIGDNAGGFTRFIFERNAEGLSGLASCTTFKLDASREKYLDEESIANMVDSLTDWSGTETVATCQFPVGKLTEEQKTTLTAKGWTYTEV